MPLTLVELKQVIDSSDFNKLIGEVEGQLFDVKGQAYRFEDGSDAKREFSKDVAAFANTRGGVILIGMHTRTGPLHIGEEIDEIRPIPKARFDPDQYRKILAEWLYPQPIGVEILWTQFGPDAAKGVGTIFIPPQDDRAKPILISA
jgi:predicted HTH transcriptional regulator